MWATLKKYNTRCIRTTNGEEIQNLELEAINKEEAENRAYLNCLLITDPEKNIRVETTRV